MKRIIALIIGIFLILSAGLLYGDEGENAIKKAEELRQSGKLQEAITFLGEFHEKYPRHTGICSTLGFYKGIMAGKTKDFAEAGLYLNDAFTLLTRAVNMAENDFLPRFHRGILGVNVPEFLGQLDRGVKDLEHFMKLSQKTPEKVPPAMIHKGLMTLARGYEKKNQLPKAIATLRKAGSRAKDEVSQAKITKKINSLQKQLALQNEQDKNQPGESEPIETVKKQIKKEPKNIVRQIKLGRLYIHEKKLDKARQTLKQVIEKDPRNKTALKLLIEVVTEMASRGYDEKIYSNTDYRSGLAFDITRLTEKICEIDPHDMEMRLMKGIVSVEMPFFVNRLEHGIRDLNMVLDGKSSDEQKASALYYLGLAHHKKMTTFWIRVAKKYKNTSAARSVFAALRPSVKRISQKDLAKPCLTIDFLLGFRDELAPQTAVWIEDSRGQFVKTVYVSGFSGFAREKQVNLPCWSDKSNYRDVDGVTRASIDQGHHIHTWNLLDYQGKKVKPGKYLVKLETSFWPSMEYQKTSASIVIGNKDSVTVQEEGNLIPYLKVNYFSRKK